MKAKSRNRLLRLKQSLLQALSRLPDVLPQAGGRSGEFSADLKGPPNSAIPAKGPGRIFITDETGKVVIDLTRKRAKVRVGRRWEKRVPTVGEIELLNKMGR